MQPGPDSTLWVAKPSKTQRRGLLRLLCCGVLAYGFVTLAPSQSIANNQNQNMGPQHSPNQLLGGKYNIQIWRKAGGIQLYNGNGGTMQVTWVDGKGGLKQQNMNGKSWALVGNPPLPVSIKAVRGVGH